MNSNTQNTQNNSAGIIALTPILEGPLRGRLIDEMGNVFMIQMPKDLGQVLITGTGVDDLTIVSFNAYNPDTEIALPYELLADPVKSLKEYVEKGEHYSMPFHSQDQRAPKPAVDMSASHADFVQKIRRYTDKSQGSLQAANPRETEQDRDVDWQIDPALLALGNRTDLPVAQPKPPTLAPLPAPSPAPAPAPAPSPAPARAPPQAIDHRTAKAKAMASASLSLMISNGSDTVEDVPTDDEAKALSVKKWSKKEDAALIVAKVLGRKGDDVNKVVKRYRRRCPGAASRKFSGSRWTRLTEKHNTKDPEQILRILVEDSDPGATVVVNQLYPAFMDQ